MKDDVDFNIDFCKAVQDFPALYDSTRTDYSRRDIQNKIWRTIGKKMGAKDTECKERWKNIRGRYQKFIKIRAIASGSPAPRKMKEYYLAPYLHFLDPFIRCRKPKYKHKASSDSSEESVDNLPLESSRKSPEFNFTTTTRNPAAKKSIDIPHTKELNETAVEEQKPKLSQDTIDPDLGFLHSLLPDMKSMSPGQKRQFKIETLNLATQILGDGLSSTWREGSSMNGCLPAYQCLDSTIPITSPKLPVD